MHNQFQPITDGPDGSKIVLGLIFKPMAQMDLCTRNAWAGAEDDQFFCDSQEAQAVTLFLTPPHTDYNETDCWRIDEYAFCEEDNDMMSRQWYVPRAWTG